MSLLQINHVTTYRYRQPVGLGEHRLMLRPRESYDQRVIEASLAIAPQPSRLRWLQDVFGNAVAVADFAGRWSQLTLESRMRVRHHPHGPDEIRIEDYARTYPFSYSSEEMPDLLRSIERQHPDPVRRLDRWARRFVGSTGATDTLGLLGAMSQAIHREFNYVRRQEKGTQTPLETLASGRGTCRDFAMLMIEAVRSLGFAARFCSGYLYHPERGSRRGGGHTHAWVRVYMPGSGWIEFDPTNGTVGSRGLVRVAVARDIYQAIPISGTFLGPPGALIAMDVSVEVQPLPGEPYHARDFGEAIERHPAVLLN